MTELVQMVPKELIVIVAYMHGRNSLDHNLSTISYQLKTNAGATPPCINQKTLTNKRYSTAIRSIATYIIKYSNIYKQMVPLTAICVDSLLFKNTEILGSFAA